MVRSITFLEAGYTEQLEKFVNPVSGKWKTIRFPSTVALIEHEKEGFLLFDTGYSPRFFEQTRYFPEKVYSLITPVKIPPEQTAIERIRKMGLNPNEIRKVILSHFHADHIAGAADFTRARFVFSHRELHYFKNLSRIQQVKNAFIGGLLPSDLEQRSVPADEFLDPIPELGTHWKGKDLFGDQSIYVVPLPGHTLGQIGLYVREVKGKNYLLVADAAWITSSFEEKIFPMKLTEMVMYRGEEYRNTLTRIHELFCSHRHSGQLEIVACHCDRAFQKLGSSHV